MREFTVVNNYVINLQMRFSILYIKHKLYRELSSIMDDKANFKYKIRVQ